MIPGFGRALALKCAKAGMTVFAGCLTQAGIDSLKAESSAGNLLPVQVLFKSLKFEFRADFTG